MRAVIYFLYKGVVSMTRNAGKQTEQALLSRGLPSDLVEKLCVAGITLKEINTSDDERLVELGIPGIYWDDLRSGDRPPIPRETVIKIIAESGRHCCACRRCKPFIIHHIVEWSKSRNHDPDNLVLLCSQCHDDAHAKRELTQNLTPERLRSLKKEWISEYKNIVKDSVLKPRDILSFPAWEYFNHSRLAELAEYACINVRELKKSDFLIQEDMVGRNGEIKKFDLGNVRFLYEGLLLHHAVALRLYYGSMIDKILSVCEWSDVSDKWNRTSFHALAKPGKLIVCRGVYRFQKKRQEGRFGVSQAREGYLKKSGIKIVFIINPYEATTSSSYGGLLSGQTPMTAFLRVKDAAVNKGSGLFVLSVTCLALGHGFGDPPLQRLSHLQCLEDDCAELEEEDEEFVEDRDTIFESE